VSRLGAIPIHVEPRPVEAAPAALSGTIGGGVAALLTEIAMLLERVAQGGEPQAIDVRSLPMSPDDRTQLVAALGSGEIEITLRADGESTIRETSVRGVWWTEYRDRHGTVVANFIEIAPVPQILVVETDELQRGAERLRAATRVPPPSREEQANA